MRTRLPDLDGSIGTVARRGASALSSGEGPEGPRAQPHEALREKLAEACVDFEALLVKQMLTVAREASGSEEEYLGSDAASGWVADTQDTVLGDAISHGRGLGLAALMFDELSRKLEAELTEAEAVSGQVEAPAGAREGSAAGGPDL